MANSETWGIMDPADSADALAIARKKAYAQALLQQSMEQPASNQMAGRVVVPVSPWQGAAQLGNAYLASKLGGQADTQEADLKQKEYTRQMALADALDKGDRRAAVMVNPKAAAEAVLSPKEPKLPAAELQEADRWLKEHPGKTYTDFMRFKASLSTQAAKDNEARPKAQFGWQYNPDGSISPVPGGPADEKAKQRASGGGDVDTMIATLRDYYDQLDKGGGITDPSKGMFENLEAGVSGSALGQGIGRMTGTQNQSTRDKIYQTRPLLLQAIKNATGMSAKQMDSNAELKMYLAAATDPALGAQANRAALDNLEKLFGSGQQPAAAKPAATLPNGWTVKAHQ